jgi:hypothetical protein
LITLFFRSRGVLIHVQVMGGINGMHQYTVRLLCVFHVFNSPRYLFLEFLWYRPQGRREDEVGSHLPLNSIHLLTRVSLRQHRLWGLHSVSNARPILYGWMLILGPTAVP